MEFKVRERVHVYAVGNGTIINQNDFREPDMEYAVLIDGMDDVVFVGAKHMKKLETEED